MAVGLGLAALERRGTSAEAVLRRKLFRILRWSEQQTGSGVATIASEGAPVGDLLLSHGRPCLAIPTSPARASSLDTALVELVEASRNTGGISAVVEGSGPERVEQVRQSLLALAAADLVSILVGAREETLNVTLRTIRDDYHPRLTLSPVELCIASLASVLSPLSELARDLVRTAECRAALVLARGRDAHELPYPIAARGLDALSLHDLFQLGRTTYTACLVEGEAACALRYVTVSDPDGVWHFVSAKHLVAVSSTRPLAESALSWAIHLATEG